VGRDKTDRGPGTRAPMGRKTPKARASLYRYGTAPRFEQASGDLLAVNHGRHDRVFRRLEQAGFMASKRGPDNNRAARFYKNTRAGQTALESQARNRAQTAAIAARFLAPGEAQR
jgi:PadR family transcriptional regulator PadR